MSIHQNAHFLEHQILEYSELTLYVDLTTYDVKLGDQSSHYIHTIECGHNNSQVLVLLHGYAGSSVLYYRMLKYLSKNFRVFCIDLPGMGLSSRNQINATTVDEAISYFVENIESWRLALNIDKFRLAGHSFGGYMACHYALKYSHRVEKLILISPVGFTNFGSELESQPMKKKRTLKRRIMLHFYKKFWDEKITPTSFYHDHPWIFSTCFKFYVQTRFNLQKEVKDCLYKFLMETFSNPTSSDLLLHLVIGPPKLKASLPLEDIVSKNLSMPVAVFYGELDRVDSTGASRIKSKNLKENYAFKIIPKASHQIALEEPQTLSQEIINFN